MKLTDKMHNKWKGFSLKLERDLSSPINKYYFTINVLSQACLALPSSDGSNTMVSNFRIAISNLLDNFLEYSNVRRNKVISLRDEIKENLLSLFDDARDNENFSSLKIKWSASVSKEGFSFDIHPN